MSFAFFRNRFGTWLHAYRPLDQIGGRLPGTRRYARAASICSSAALPNSTLHRPTLGVGEIVLEDADLVSGVSYDLDRALQDGINPADDLTIENNCNFVTTFTSTARPGDANFDGVVDFFDFLDFARNFRRTDAIWPEGDFTFDRKVDLSDFLEIARNYDQPTPTQTRAAAVPEPTGTWPWGFGFLALALFARKRRR